MRRQNLKVIPNYIFQSRNLPNLQKISLSKCNIEYVADFAFQNLSNLDRLDLSWNNLSFVPSSTFDSITQLRELDLTGNPLGPVIKNHVFQQLANLIKLQLASSNIRFVQPKAFYGLHNLKWLNLDGNQLNYLHPSVMAPLGKSLHGMELRGNPWNCTCDLMPFRQWMFDRNIPTNANPPSCSSPKRLEHKTWQDLDLDEYACPPRILFAGLSAISSGKNQITFAFFFPGPTAEELKRLRSQSEFVTQNITLTCRVAPSKPDPEVEWAWQGFPIRDGALGKVGSSIYIVSEWSTPYYKVSNLTILFAGVDHTGTYTCTVLNKAGEVTVGISLSSIAKPVFVASKDVQKQKALVIIPSKDKEDQGLKKLGAVIAVVSGTLAAFLSIAVAYIGYACRSRTRRHFVMNREIDNERSSTSAQESVPSSSPAREPSIKSAKVRFNLRPIILFNGEEDQVSFTTMQPHDRQEDVENLCRLESSRWSFPSSKEASNSPSDMEQFLKDYHELQNQLTKMQTSCDNLQQDSIKQEMENLKASIMKSAGILEKEVEKAIANSSNENRY